jgi:hypothetical protein
VPRAHVAGFHHAALRPVRANRSRTRHRGAHDQRMTAALPPERGELPARPRALGWLAYAGAWLALGVWLGINVVIGHRNSGSDIAPWEPMTWELSSVALMAILALAIAAFERRFPLSGTGWPRRIWAHMLAVPVFSLLHTVGMVGIRKLVYALHGRAYDFGNPLLGYVYELQKDLISYALIAAACVGLRALRMRRERELAMLRLERDLGEARLAQLTAQIEPHFMFNTLNAIANRMHEDVEAADRMIAAFAGLLRAALVETGGTQVTVAEDVAWLERYFGLMRERFRGKLETRLEVDPAALAARIPRLLLQPLVENAFEHGLKGGRGRVVVAIRVVRARLVCTVEDDGVGVAVDAGTGIGLANVRDRLGLLYPGDHAFEIVPRAGGGTRTMLSLPIANDDG